MNLQPPPDALPPDFETRLPDDLDVQHCYRHPRRETGVSCSNCGRPICHECMIPAAVGFRCPECVKEQKSRGTRARVVSRGQIRSRWGTAGGVVGTGGITVTKVLVALNVLMFVIEIVTRATTAWGGGSASALVSLGALVPFASDVPNNVLVAHEYWRMFTSMFLHSGILHLAFNMWALWVIGGFVEVAVGRARFLILYFVSGFAGSVLVLVAAPVNSLVVGASGAIFGLFGALAVHAFLNRGRDFQSQALLRNILFILVINLVFSFTAGFISWQAHVGGLVAGAALMYAFMLGGKKDPRGQFARFDLVSVLVIVFVLVAITWWRVTTFIA